MKFNEITESLIKIKILKSYNRRILTIKKCNVNDYRKLKISNTKQIGFEVRFKLMVKVFGRSNFIWNKIPQFRRCNAECMVSKGNGVCTA